jgi:Glycosyl hydrolase family 115/Gylcosyl hydrolase family 115 C-terminal domain
MKRVCLFIALACASLAVYSQQFITTKMQPGDFPISAKEMPTIVVDGQDNWLVLKVASLLQTDMGSVTGVKPALVTTLDSAGKNSIIIGTLDGSAIIKDLIARKQVDASQLAGQWEAFQLKTIANASPTIKSALVITGSDKRGAAFGVFELSKQLGVSPWYWWADVPPAKKLNAWVKKGVYNYASPSVKYRGIFINDEAPAFSGWTKEKFGGVNHLVYEKMFELLLRLKGNYLWPAMWGNAFNDDDTLDPILANKWGIVMGTSHHEPMVRAQQEWKRYGKGPWDYTKNDTVLRAFWKKGIENMKDHESIVTVGMRGDGDMPMTKGTATELLERIVADQRKILTEVTGKPADQTPQLWALYKEVQDYYDKGMRVPDDVTLLLCDDNWGNIRRLPKMGDKPRSGGYGIYYHFDYVGGPRNYKWLNTNNITRVWEQMHAAYEYGVDRIWVVNVGDLKPMEFPISFFLDYAYDTKKWNEKNIMSFYTRWAGDQFGASYAQSIGKLLSTYARYSSRRKPELLDASTYSLTNFNEFKNVVNEWAALRQQAEQVERSLDTTHKDAFFELVLHPILALENLHQMYYAVAMNKALAEKKDAAANQWADKAKQYYATDSLLTIRYNTALAGGKWSHMMDQTHIGYRSWQEPRRNSLPVLTYLDAATMNTSSASALSPEMFFPIAATNYTRAVSAPGIQWTVIPEIGKNGDGITTFPVTKSLELSAASPHLEYVITTNKVDSLKLSLYFSPTLNVQNESTGLRFAISIDNEQPQIVGLNPDDNTGVWNAWVANNNIVKTVTLAPIKAGQHTIKYWMIDPLVIFQKITVSSGPVPPSYLVPNITSTTKKISDK